MDFIVDKQYQFLKDVDMIHWVFVVRAMKRMLTHKIYIYEGVSSKSSLLATLVSSWIAVSCVWISWPALLRARPSSFCRTPFSSILSMSTSTFLASNVDRWRGVHAVGHCCLEGFNRYFSHRLMDRAWISRLILWRTKKSSPHRSLILKFVSETEEINLCE